MLWEEEENEIVKPFSVGLKEVKIKILTIWAKAGLMLKTSRIRSTENLKSREKVMFSVNFLLKY